MQAKTTDLKMFKCRNCFNNKLFFYDGLLGYESVKCEVCGFEHTDEKPILPNGSD